MEVDSHFPPLTLKKEGFSEWTHLYISFIESVIDN